ncbi:HK97 family phage prohead protease [Marininema halotolerans]|uniref:Prohead serine protease domain-containing protein n=1 Tax=Marininema halotolerans TaxID=1155944 RepID=A0A1I6URX3_9BACL|nr:HK97 family phage prohead protease [Marininema halotolerans]SFT04150.1 hypothetical protein SAMN05444972_11943 [Marininema halotolerans]
MSQPTMERSKGEVRTLPILELNTRTAEGSKKPKISGRAAVYDEFTEIQDYWGDTFHERIQKGAISESISKGHDIFALRNHNWSDVLGRTGANLTLSDKEEGLYFELAPNDSTLGRDTMEDIRSGLIKGCSIGFRIEDEEWEERDGAFFRTITEIELLEVTLTPIPAYTSTTAEVRSLTPDLVQSKIKQGSMEDEERQAILAEANRIQKHINTKGGY